MQDTDLPGWRVKKFASDGTIGTKLETAACRLLFHAGFRLILHWLDISMFLFILNILIWLREASEHMMNRRLRYTPYCLIFLTLFCIAGCISREAEASSTPIEWTDYASQLVLLPTVSTEESGAEDGFAGAFLGYSRDVLFAYEQPGTGARTEAVFSPFTPLHVIGREGEYYEIDTDEGLLYVPAGKLTRLAEDTDADPYGAFLKHATILYEQPLQGAKALAVLSQPAYFRVTAYNGDYARILLEDGTSGYVTRSAAALQGEQPGAAATSAPDGLPYDAYIRHAAILYELPPPNSKVLTVLSPPSACRVTAYSGGYARVVLSDGITGYVPRSALTEDPVDSAPLQARFGYVNVPQAATPEPVNAHVFRLIAKNVMLQPFEVYLEDVILLYNFTATGQGVRSVPLPSNSLARVVAENGEYYYVQHTYGEGYIRKDQASPLDEGKLPPNARKQRYYLFLNKAKRELTVYFADAFGNRTDKEYMKVIVAIGKATTPTPSGIFILGGKERWHYFGPSYAPFAIYYAPGRWLHGPLYSSNDEKTLNQARLADFGTMSTGGCIRTPYDVMLWIYVHCMAGDTRLEVVSGG